MIWSPWNGAACFTKHCMPSSRSRWLRQGRSPVAKKPVVSLSVCLLFGLAAWGALRAAQPSGHLQPTAVPLPDGSAGIGFDDLDYSPDLKKVIVPAGRTGNLDLIDPQTLAVTTIAGFSAQDKYGGGH